MESVSFDFKIVAGTSLFDSRMISLCSACTNLHAGVAVMPVPGQWGHYEFQLTPATFGVSVPEFDQVMRDVVLLGIRSEWIDGSEVEVLDNFRLSKASDAYWTWISSFYGGDDLANESKAGRLADPDGDGADNWSEFIADTAPTNRLDCLRIDSVSISNAACRLDFRTRPGRLYGVETASALSPAPAWSVVADDIPGTGLSLSVTDGAADTPRLYRLKVRRSE